MVIVKGEEDNVLKKISINNYKLFNQEFVIDNFNILDETNMGTGLTIIVGENGCGKTTILDSIAISMLDYRAESFNIYDFNEFNKEVNIVFYSNKEFDVKGTMPNSDFKAIGFNFNAKVRNKVQKNYLVSPIVYDQLYISSNSDKPLMSDFNFQYIKNTDNIEDLNIELNNKVKKDKIENAFLENAIQKFQTISGYHVWLDFIDNYRPFKNSSFVLKENNNIQIPLSSIGSGFEMIFSLIYSYYLSKQNNKKMIILIDEPELHLHPDVQKKFVDFLLEISKDTQVIITTHSPILVKQLMYNEFVKSIVIHNDKTISDISDLKLSYLSSNEINYIAFGLATEEYHNELYEEIKSLNGNTLKIKDFDNQFFVVTKNQQKLYPWIGNANEVSIHTFIRNQIHHRKDNGEAKYDDLKSSIDFMRSCL